MPGNHATHPSGRPCRPTLCTCRTRHGSADCGWLDHRRRIAARCARHPPLPVLIITCPCALALGRFPAVQGRRVRQPVSVAALSSTRLTRLNGLPRSMWLCSTRPAPSRCRNRASPTLPTSIRRFLEMAARLGLSSKHPLAVAVSHEARVRSPFDGAKEVPGQGISAMIYGMRGSPRQRGILRHRRWKSDIGRSGDIDDRVFVPGPACGSVGSSGIASRCGRGLSRRCRRSVWKSGYCRGTGSRPSNPLLQRWALAIGRVGSSPPTRSRAIEALKAEGRHVLMVGDGMNDAPALAAAYVSLSPISAADIAQANADAIFVGDRLQPAFDVIAVARQAKTSDEAEPCPGCHLQRDCGCPIAIAGVCNAIDRRCRHVRFFDSCDAQRVARAPPSGADRSARGFPHDPNLLRLRPR